MHMQTSRRLISPRLMPSLTTIAIRDGCGGRDAIMSETLVTRASPDFRRGDWHDVVRRADKWLGRIAIRFCPDLRRRCGGNE